ncbi:MAG: methylenetetrahydrofolate--tRNA-(uracil(54)-C(5))-methyltransferase (FADH(2)-oxidizing) TrmFO [Desulfomonilia bacterium]|nr:methylenetetrahydrofolate--tRNA-(uracil(54)-C(5))-methyltransferase (FADH(2)-oxidizing) TrmFO [Desulfomonilia bacterium]
MIGAGLAGVEAAHFLAGKGIPVSLYEMRPERMTPAHQTGLLAELVCSNSFKGTDPVTAHGMLKQEMTGLGSLVIQVAFQTQVPAGKALAVDRNAFATSLTRRISSLDHITLVRQEVQQIDPEQYTIVATGPLTSDILARDLAEKTGSGSLFFYDAISPIVDATSVDMTKAFFGSRWDPQSTDYLNIPLDEELYKRFIDALLHAETVQPHSFENTRYFDACLPIEVIAARGRDAPRYGPMRPVGFHDPATGKRPHALIQLRRENLTGQAYNLVGFQTRLAYPEQERVLRMIPALSRVVLLRHGSIHRNTFLDSPRVLSEDLSLRAFPKTFLAGQLTGVEGYMESAATGILAGLSLFKRLLGQHFTPPEKSTALGALVSYITRATRGTFQPMNINFGIMSFPEVSRRDRDKARFDHERREFSRWLKTL